MSPHEKPCTNCAVYTRVVFLERGLCPQCLQDLAEYEAGHDASNDECSCEGCTPAPHVSHGRVVGGISEFGIDVLGLSLEDL